MNEKVLVIGATATSLLALLVALVSLVLMLDMKGDTAALVEQSRKTAKAVKALQEDVAALRAGLAPEPVPTEHAEPAPAPLQPVHIDAADRKRDCVLRPGDARRLVECIKGPG